MFNFNLQDDLYFLINSWGYDVTINDEQTKAIINNSDLEEISDDKKIISFDEVHRGDYIKYQDIWYLVVSESNTIRYNNHYRAMMRTCNYPVIFTIDKRLYYFPTAISKERFGTSQTGGMIFATNTIAVALRYNENSKKIKEDSRFIAMDRPYKVKNVDYTKKGLVILFAEQDIWAATDDGDKGIVDKDTIEDDTIIYPFDDDSGGEEPEPSGNYSIEISGYDDIALDTTEVYTAKVYDGNDLVEKDVVWSISNPLGANVEMVSQNPMQCTVYCKQSSKYVKFGVIATLVDNEDVTEEKLVQVVRY